MNVKKIFVTTYKVLTIVVTVIEAVELGKSIHGKFKNKSSVVSAEPITPAAETVTVEGAA